MQHLHTVGRGCPDLLVGYFGTNIVIEVKQPGEKLTPDEQEWHAKWQGYATIVYTEDDANRILDEVEEDARQ